MVPRTKKGWKTLFSSLSYASSELSSHSQALYLSHFLSCKGIFSYSSIFQTVNYGTLSLYSWTPAKPSKSCSWHKIGLIISDPCNYLNSGDFHLFLKSVENVTWRIGRRRLSWFDANDCAREIFDTLAQVNLSAEEKKMNLLWKRLH